MITTFKILLIFLCVLLLYSDIHLFYRRRLKVLCNRTKHDISKLGTNIALIGATGDGKTTTAAGITNYLIEIIIANCQSRMDKIRKQLYFVNFNFLERFYIQYLDITNDFDLALAITVDYYDFEHRLKMFTTDNLSVDSCYTLLRDYILYFNILNFNKSFVYSKGYFIDRVTCNVSNLFDSSSIELRNVFEEKNFQAYPGMIIFDDEKSLERGNVFSNNKDVKLSGSKEFFALIRNMMKEMTYHVVMKQTSDDEVKQERLLINASLMIFDRKDFIASFPLLRFIISIPFKLLDLFVTIYFNFVDLNKSIVNFFKKDKYSSFSSKEIFIKKNNFYRKLEYKTYMATSLLLSMSYIRVRMFRYYKADDVGKRTENTFDRLVLYFPIQYCYGCVDTYEYYQSAYPIFNELRKNKIDATVSKFNPSPRKERLKKIFRGEKWLK